MFSWASDAHQAIYPSIQQFSYKRFSTVMSDATISLGLVDIISSLFFSVSIESDLCLSTDVCPLFYFFSSKLPDSCPPGFIQILNANVEIVANKRLLLSPAEDPGSILQTIYRRLLKYFIEMKFHSSSTELCPLATVPNLMTLLSSSFP